MTDQNKKRVRFNVIDVFIILALIAVVTGVALRYDIADKIGVKSETDTVIVSFLVREIKESSADAMVLGDIFYLDSNSIELGELITKKPTYAEAFIENDEGVIVKTYNENAYDVRGEIKATGRMTSSGFMLGGTQYIAAGKEIKVSSKNIMFTILITGVTSAE